MEIRESEFLELIKKYEHVLYLCHRNADPDALGSASALQNAFGGDVGAVEDVSRAGRSLISALGLQPIMDPDTREYDLVVVVDTSVRLQIGGLKLDRYAVVDHHLDRGLVEGALFYIQRPACSTAEIVWGILKESGVRVTKEMALALMVGIISDTGRFRRATPEAFFAAAQMLEAGGLQFEDALGVLSRAPADPSQRIAVLKAASRASIQRAGDWVLAGTEINAFEGASAMALVDIGADAAFAAGKHGEISRVSGRAGRDAVKAGLDISEVMRTVAALHGGEGGGHRAAAALEARGEPQTFLDGCLAMTKSLLEAPPIRRETQES